MSHTKRYISSKDFVNKVIKQHQAKGTPSQHSLTLSMAKAYDHVKTECAKAQPTSSTNYSVSESTQYNVTPMNTKVRGRDTRKRQPISAAPTLRKGTFAHY